MNLKREINFRTIVVYLIAFAATSYLIGVVWGRVNMKDKPPLILDEAKLLEYAIVDSSVEYTGRETLYVGGKLLGQVPKLAICQNYKEQDLLLFHCNTEWEVQGAVFYKSIDELKNRIERVYKGINKKWIKVASPNDFKNWPSDLDRGICIHQAVLSGKLEIVRKLLDVKIACVNSISHPSVDEPHRLEHWTPLIGAAALGYNEIVQLLIDKGADVNAKDNDGKTALMRAKNKNHTKIVALLKQHGAKE